MTLIELILESDEKVNLDRDALKKWRKPLPQQKGGRHKNKKAYDRKRENSRRDYED